MRVVDVTTVLLKIQLAGSSDMKKQSLYQVGRHQTDTTQIKASLVNNGGRSALGKPQVTLVTRPLCSVCLLLGSAFSLITTFINISVSGFGTGLVPLAS